MRASGEESQTQSTMDEKINVKPMSESASPDFRDAGERWLAKLPEGKRAKLKSALSTAKTDAEKMQLLMASAETDNTKVRAAEKRALLEALATPIVQ